MKRAVIYTSLTGGYDDLPQYEVIDSDFDYVCFTNDYPAGSKVGQWDIRPIPIESKDKTRLSRYVKLMPHAVFPDYEYSIWLDANLIITSQEIYEILKRHIAASTLWCGIKHPQRDCIYEDICACLKSGKVAYNEVIQQIQFLKKEGYPTHFGLYENNFIIRKHNDIRIIQIDDAWWHQYQMYSRRDQFSLFYLFWKQKFQPAYIFADANITTHNSKYIKFIKHNRMSFYKRVCTRLKCWYNDMLLYTLNPF